MMNRGLLKSLITTSGLLFFILNIHAQYPQSFFLDDYEPKDAVIPPYVDRVQTIQQPTVEVDIDINDTITRVSKYIFGNNANTYMTQMVTQPDLIYYIDALAPNVIRYPGGNLSSIFFWNSPVNQPPADAPDQLVDSDGNPYNVGYWYGKNNDSWTLSLDNYYEMLDQTNSTGIITINYGYARYGTGDKPAEIAAGYAADWVRYDNGRTKYWEIGNESGGPWQAGFRIDLSNNKDGQPEIVSGALYGEHFKIFADSMRAAAAEIGSEIFIGAQLIHYDAANSWNPVDRDWNEGFYSSAGNYADYFIIHTYYTPYNENSPPSTILNSGFTETRNMMNYVSSNTADNGIDMKPLTLTEWNIFAVGSKQACSYINGMHAAIVLGYLTKYQYGLAARWDLANGYDNGNDHGMFNNRDEPGVPDWNPRPVYFYMYYFQKYLGDHMIQSSVTGSSLVDVFASRFASGELGVVIVNRSNSDQVIRLNTGDFDTRKRYYLYNLAGGTDNGEFSQKVYVNDQGPDNLTGGPINNLEYIEAWSYKRDTSFVISSQLRSVQYILIQEDDGTDIEHYRQLSNIEVYPNPASGFFRIESDFAMTDVDIIGIDGRKAYHSTIKPGSFHLDLELEVPLGIYIVRASDGNKSAVRRIVIDQ